MIKTFNYLIQSLLIYIFFFIGRLIGLNLSRKFFSFIFSLIAPFFKSKKIIENNLNFYSKNITKDEKEKIISSMWKNYGMTFIEYIFLNFLKKNKSHIKIQGEEYLENIIKKGKPVIFVSGHFANFELMSMEITKKNIPLAAIYRPLNNFFLNPFMEYLRKKYICKNQIKKGINGDLVVDLTCHFIKDLPSDFATSSANIVLPVPGSPFISKGLSRVIEALTAKANSSVATYLSDPVK